MDDLQEQRATCDELAPQGKMHFLTQPWKAIAEALRNRNFENQRLHWRVQELEQQQRSLFQQYLQGMGYQITRDSPVFEQLLQLYLGGEWSQMVETEFAPMWVWQSHVAEKLLEPYKRIEFQEEDSHG